MLPGAGSAWDGSSTRPQRHAGACDSSALAVGAAPSGACLLPPRLSSGPAAPHSTPQHPTAPAPAPQRQRPAPAPGPRLTSPPRLASPRSLIDKKNARRYDDCIKYTMVAGRKALIQVRAHQLPVCACDTPQASGSPSPSCSCGPWAAPRCCSRWLAAGAPSAPCLPWKPMHAPALEAHACPSLWRARSRGCGVQGAQLKPCGVTLLCCCAGRAAACRRAWTRRPMPAPSASWT